MTDLYDHFAISGIDPATGTPATAVVVALGSETLTITIGAPIPGGTAPQVFEAAVFEAGVFE